MAEELQSLIDRIRQEGIDKARAQADEIIASAEKQAADIIRSAKASAEEFAKQSAESARANTERSIKSIQQAGRDALIAVGEGVKTLFTDLLRESVSDVLGPAELAGMIAGIVKSYMESDGAKSVDVLVNSVDRERLKGLIFEKYGKALGSGVEILPDAGIMKGFKVSLQGGRVQYDFTLDAITDALASFLRPELEAVVRAASKAPLS